MAERTFKTAWFAKAARKARITDAELCKAIRQVALGQADDLGGGVFKKRLNDNMHRSIILANAGSFWVFAYLFAKKNKSNINNSELTAFRNLADLYRRKSPEEILQEQQARQLLEICHENES